MATQAELDTFNAMYAAGNFSGAANYAASLGYSNSDVAAYVTNTFGDNISALSVEVAKQGTFDRAPAPAPAPAPTGNEWMQYAGKTANGTDAGGFTQQADFTQITDPNIAAAVASANLSGLSGDAYNQAVSNIIADVYPTNSGVEGMLSTIGSGIEFTAPIAISALMPGAISPYLPGATGSLTNAMLTGAVTGGTTALAAGQDPITGAVLGAGGGAISNATSGLFNTGGTSVPTGVLPDDFAWSDQASLGTLEPNLDVSGWPTDYMANTPVQFPSGGDIPRVEVTAPAPTPSAPYIPYVPYTPEFPQPVATPTTPRVEVTGQQPADTPFDYSGLFSIPYGASTATGPEQNWWNPAPATPTPTQPTNQTPSGTVTVTGTPPVLPTAPTIPYVPPGLTPTPTPTPTPAPSPTGTTPPQQPEPETPRVVVTPPTGPITPTIPYAPPVGPVTPTPPTLPPIPTLPGGTVATPTDTLDWNSLIKGLLGLGGGLLSQNSAEKSAAIAAQAQKDMLASNQAFYERMLGGERTYASQLDQLQQARLAGYNTASQAALTGLTPAQVAAANAQYDLEQQTMLSKAGLESKAAQYDAAARQRQAAGLANVAQQAVDMSKFTPYGMTTRFGTSTPEGTYALTPEMKAQQDALMGVSGAALNQYAGAQGATAPMGEGAQRMMTLGQGYLATTPQEQAAKYYADQQALLATSRDRDYASLENRLKQQGRLGLSMGATGQMGAANPEMEALMNARRQQDLTLAAQATQGGQQYAQFGGQMLSGGGDLLKNMYGTQSAAYAPYSTAMGGVQNLESAAQQALTMGTDLGKLRAQYGNQAAQLGMQGAEKAFAAQYAAEAPAAQYADYLAMQNQAVSGLQPFQRTASQTGATLAEKQKYLDQILSQTGMFAQQAATIPRAGAVSAPAGTYGNPSAVPTAPASNVWGQALTSAASGNYDWSGLLGKLWS